ncbi:Na+/H+ antiporter subunit E [Rheinheimera sp. 1928-s]|uniref:Na+/H+ antiporter subunit E n=1 Tax=Rheinheimera sp. 1928-s TaxID=3033803 RepID=UPI002615D6DD|nr:Na+/H+ antiporter subunit E [Rheinheimera sp. 1928-s]MDF3123604.1 Na+/H+ antiporter subunit E [Rheinheimera sp. 1928-s]
MNSLKKWWPTPVRSLFLFLVWLLLNNSVEFFHLFFGLVLAWLIPQLIHKFRLIQPGMKNPGAALRYGFMVLWDIVVANMQVVKLVLGPNKRLRPAFIKIPLDLTDNLSITILASTVSLTPGTVSAEVLALNVGVDEPRYLLVHVLDLADEAELIQQVKQRYEAPLKEIF